MAVYILKRLGLALITLWILSMIVFLAGQKLPGDPGRVILGNLASPQGVAQLNHQLGVDRPIVTQYTDWVTNLLHGDMGTSYSYQAADQAVDHHRAGELAQARAGGVSDLRAAGDPLGGDRGAQVGWRGRIGRSACSGCRCSGCPSSSPACS